MQIINDLEFHIEKPTAVALGTFDGVHLGHRAVISAAVERAREDSLLSAVFTFSCLPKNAFLPPEKRISPLCSAKEKAGLISSLGVDLLISPDFTQKLASMSPESFVNDILFGRLNAKHIVCGFDHRFGRGGEGSPELLSELCALHGAGITIIPPVTVNGRRVSSTAIRRLIEEGRLSEAGLLLGRDLKKAETKMNELVAYCGVDCSACPDLESGKCPGCRNTEWPEGGACMPVDCCKKKGVPFCGLCDTFPCPDMAEFYEESEGHKKALGLMLALRREN